MNHSRNSPTHIHTNNSSQKEDPVNCYNLPTQNQQRHLKEQDNRSRHQSEKEKHAEAKLYVIQEQAFN